MNYFSYLISKLLSRHLFIEIHTSSMLILPTIQEIICLSPLAQTTTPNYAGSSGWDPSDMWKFTGSNVFKKYMISSQHSKTKLTASCHFFHNLYWLFVFIEFTNRIYFISTIIMMWRNAPLGELILSHFVNIFVAFFDKWWANSNFHDIFNIFYWKAINIFVDRGIY